MYKLLFRAALLSLAYAMIEAGSAGVRYPEGVEGRSYGPMGGHGGGGYGGGDYGGGDYGGGGIEKGFGKGKYPLHYGKNFGQAAFSDAIWKDLTKYVKPYMPWPGEFVNKHEGKTYFAKAPPIFIDRPPIYKTIRQEVFIRQPVIINKVPVIKKQKEVTIKKQPPTYEFVKDPKVVVKDFQHQGKAPKPLPVGPEFGKEGGFEKGVEGDIGKGGGEFGKGEGEYGKGGGEYGKGGGEYGKGGGEYGKEGGMGGGYGA